MKATLLNDEEMVNPKYLSATDRTGIDQILILPAGETIDDPDSWMLCAIGKAVPADDECKKRHDEYIGDPARKKLLEQVRRLRAANGVQQLDAKTRKWLDYMEKTYSDELGIVTDNE